MAPSLDATVEPRVSEPVLTGRPRAARSGLEFATINHVGTTAPPHQRHAFERRRGLRMAR